jgi:hypothetical protein
MVWKKLVATMGMVLLATTSFAQNGNRSWSFDSENTGEIAKDFRKEVGGWKVLADSTAPSTPNVLVQGAKNSGSAFNLTLINGTRYEDLELSVQMKPFAGTEDQGGGPVWRAKDAKNYYVARYNPLEDNYRVYKVEKGRRTQLGNADINHTEGWHTLGVTMKGDHIEAYYDGNKVLDLKDTTFPQAGEIGLWTKADAQTHFDDLRVSGGN